MKIAFVALWSPTRRKYWSGTPWYSYRALTAVHPEITLIDTPILDKLLFYGGKVTRKLGLDLLREPLVRALYARLVNRRIAQTQPDLIISVGASHKLCDIETDARIFHAADALFATILASYGTMASMSKRSRRLGDAIQRRFLEKVDALFLSSDWAVASAREHYDLSHCRLMSLPLGANLDSDPGFDSARRREKQTLSLLFVGGDWARKGGPLLLEIFRVLRRQEPGTRLDIVGCSPDIGAIEGVVVHGPLDKSTPEEAERLDALFRDAAFLLVPSRQEAFGIVYCEACAYGLPPIGTDTGGVASIIVDGENGLLLALAAGPEEYAARVLALWRDRAEYEALCDRARDHFETRLSWEAWAKILIAAAKEDSTA